MRISGLVLLEKINCQSLTPFFNIYGDPNAAWDVARALKAYNDALYNLAKIFEEMIAIFF